MSDLKKEPNRIVPVAEFCGDLDQLSERKREIECDDGADKWRKSAVRKPSEDRRTLKGG